MTRSEAANLLRLMNQATESVEELVDDYPEVWMVSRAYEHAVNAEGSIQAFLNGLIYEDES
jgi:uncharacterized protein (DUF433 family)